MRAGLRYLVDLGGKPVYPEPHHLLTLGYLAEPMNAKGWRVFDAPGDPAAVKVPALMELWCRRLPRWSPEDAYRALLKVQPFGRANGVVALLVYQRDSATAAPLVAIAQSSHWTTGTHRRGGWG